MKRLLGCVMRLLCCELQPDSELPRYESGAYRMPTPMRKSATSRAAPVKNVVPEFGVEREMATEPVFNTRVKVGSVFPRACSVDLRIPSGYEWALAYGLVV